MVSLSGNQARRGSLAAGEDGQSSNEHSGNEEEHPENRRKDWSRVEKLGEKESCDDKIQKLFSNLYPDAKQVQ